MKFDKAHWKELDINIDSLWIIGPRAKGGKRENNYHGNFCPQVPDNLIRRYTEENEIVVDLFMGSGTTLYECETLKRNYIGFDINQDIIDVVESKMTDCKDIQFYINNCDVTNSTKFSQAIESNLSSFKTVLYVTIVFIPASLNIGANSIINL
jgi:DNA modification methylase